MSKTIPEEYRQYTLGLAVVDAVPVLLFLMSTVVIYSMYGSPVFLAGAIACFLGGSSKVLWKLIVVLKEQDTEVLASEKAVNESKLVSLTVDSIKYYDKLRSQMPTDDLKSILDDVCRNLIDNLILSCCTPINEEPGFFDMSRHRVEPFQMVGDGTPYSKVTRKGVVYKNEVKLLAIVEL